MDAIQAAKLKKLGFAQVDLNFQRIYVGSNTSQ
jgi:hypothetical protein